MKRLSGYSILELIAVLAILSVLVTSAAAILRMESLGNFGAQTVAQTLASDLQLARRMAITSANDHYLLFTTAGSSITGYTIYKSDGGVASVDAYREIPAVVTVTIDPSTSQTPSFTFEGLTASTFTFTVAGPDRSYSVAVQAATGRPIVSQL